jgi:PAS domain S-box-containing protein
MLQSLSRTAASVLDLDQLTGMILDAVTSTMHIGQAAILLKQGDSGGFRLVAQRGLLKGDDLWFSEGHPMARWLREHDRILTRSEVDVLPLFKSLWGQEKADLEKLGAELFIPLKVKGDMVGIFAAGSKLSEQSYSQADLLTLSTLANQTAVAVENARLYAAEHRRVDESLLLLDIAAAVGSTLNLTQMLKTIAQRTAEACGAQRCSIFLLDEQHQTIQPLMSQYASGHRNQILWEQFRHSTYGQKSTDVSALEQVIRDRQPLVLDADSVARLPEAWIQPFNIRSLMVLPLVSRDRVIGMMALDHQEAGKHFGQEQVNLAMTISSQAAVAIENARLYEQTTQEKARTETILRETFSGIMVVDGELRIVSMNPGAELITDCRADEVIGKPVGLILGADITSPGSPLAKAREANLKVPPAETVVEVRGGVRDVLLGVTPLPAANHGDRRCLLSFADISKLKEVDRLRSSIVANVSHELRTPLASIKAYTELLLAEVEGADLRLRQEWLRVIEHATDRVTALVDDILSLARLESQRVELVREPVDIEGLVASVLSLLQIQADQRGIVLETKLAGNLPCLMAEHTLMEIVVKNLVDNAIKFSRDGGRVQISVWQDSKVVKLSVADQGIGIPQDALPQLFTKFFRVASADAAAVQGTGLGLALVKQAVAAHGGHIEVKSKLGKGSCFTVSIPLAEVLSLSGQQAGKREVDRTPVS